MADAVAALRQRCARVRTARVIPCLDVDAGRVVKGVNFVDLRDAGDPVELAARYDAEGADELVFLDITASSDAPRHDGRRRRRAPPSRCSSRSPSAAASARSTTPAGCCGPAPTRCRSTPRRSTGPSSIAEIADEFGAQCVVVAIDARRRRRRRRAGRSSPTAAARPTGLDAVAWAGEVERLGAGEILLTSMDRDGTRDGFDLELTRAVGDAVDVPVIASGGVGTLEHLVEGVTEGGADAVLAASIFHFGEHTVAEAKQVLAAGDHGPAGGGMSGLRRVALLGVVAALALTAAACGGDDSKDAAPAPNGGPAVGQPPGDLTCPPPNITTIDPSSLKVDAEPVGSLVSGKPRPSRSPSPMSLKAPCRWSSPRASRRTSC